MEPKIRKVPPPIGVRLDSLKCVPYIMRGWQPRFWGSVVWNLTVHLATAIAAGAAALAVSLAFAGSATSMLVTPILVIFGATIARALAQWQESYTSHELSFRVLARVRGWVYDALARVAPGGIQQRRRGDLSSTTMNDCEVLEIFTAHSSLYQTSRIVGTPLLVGLVMMVNVPVGLSVIPLLALLWAVSIVARRVAMQAGDQARQQMAVMASDAQENASAIREIAAFGLLDIRQQRLSQQQRILDSAQRKQILRSGINQSFAGVVQGIVVIVATVVAVAQVRNGTLDVVWLPVATTLASVTASPQLQWLSVCRHEGNVAAAADRIGEIIDAVDPTPVDPTVAPTRDEPQAAVKVENLTFQWPSAQRVTLSDINLTIERGEHVAIAGRSGSGKSTLAQLLARWYDPDQGRVVVGGRDVRSLDRAEVARAVRLVPQFPHVFSETVRENLLLATDRPLRDDELWQALHAVGMDEVIGDLPDGLDTVLTDSGRSLSGGERQRLALARIVLEPAPVLILDEAVSALDTQRELSIQGALTSAGETTLVIAHRLVTLIQSPRILVLDQGRLVGDGSHEQLLQTCRHYQSLVGPQLSMTSDR